MATALAAQLQALTTSTRRDNGAFLRQKTRPSILFDAGEAADVDTATIFTLALSGLEELAKENPSFINFKKTLFSIQSCQTDRELQDREFNVSLDKSIRDFLYMISDFALLTTAHQTLEYLIRRYKVHTYNADDLIKCILPYHETILFVRILQLSDIEKTRWQFLGGVIKSGAAPPRELLVQQCLNDAGVLDGIFEIAPTLKIWDKAIGARTAYSFTVAIIIEVLDTAQMVDSILVKKILAFLLQSFGKGSSEERKIGGLMIIGTLVKKVKISDEAITLLFDLIVRAIGVVNHGALFDMAVMVTIQLIQTQSVSEIPEKILRAIGIARELSTVLSKICASFNAEYALTSLSNGLIRHCVSNHHYKTVLEELIRAAPSRAIIQSTTLSLLALIAECLQSEDSTKRDMKAKDLSMVMASLREASSDGVDFAINEFLKNYGGKMDGLVALLNNTFTGSLSFVLPESNQTVRGSLQHSQAAARIPALQQTAAVAKSNPEMTIICSEALLLGLRDVELSVVSSVLSVDGLENILNAEDLFSSLASLIERCVSLLCNAASSSRGEALLVGKQCLKFMTSAYVKVHPKYAHRVGLLLLNNMLCTPKCWRLNLAAVKAATNVNWILFKGLGELEDENFRQSEKNGKVSRKRWLFEVNTRLVEAFANILSENVEILVATDLISGIGNLEGAKLLVVLALLHCLKKFHEASHEGLDWEVVSKYSEFLRKEWIAMESSKDFPLFKINIKDVEMEDVHTLEFFNVLYQEPKRTYVYLLIAGFHKVLKCFMDMNSCKAEYKQSVCRALEGMFGIFSSPDSKGIFEQHLRLLLRKLPISAVSFLSFFFNAEGGSIPVTAQINSLTVLLSVFNDSASLSQYEIQSAVSHLVVALANPVKDIRRTSLECLRKLAQMWTESSALPNGSQLEIDMLDSKSFEAFLEAIIEQRDCFVSSKDFILNFFTDSLGFFNGDEQSKADNKSIFKLTKSTKLAIFHFFVKAASLMPLHEQATLLIVLKGAVCMREQALSTKELLESLLKNWKISKLDKLNQANLSKYEVQIFRHLLQVHLHHECMFSACEGKPNGTNAGFKLIMEFLEMVQIDNEESLDLDTIETLCVVFVALEERVFQRFDEKCQDIIFKSLIEVSLSNQQQLQAAARTALQKIKANPAVVQRFINKILAEINVFLKELPIVNEKVIQLVNFMTAALEFLLSQCDIDGMHGLVSPLFECLRMSISLSSYGDKFEIKAENDKSRMQLEGIHNSYIQQLVLELLEKILTFKSGNLKEAVKDLYEVDYLVDFVRGTRNGATLNQAFSLLATLGREFPDLMLQHVISLFSVVGETTMIQDDTQSYVVIERLLAAVIPNWLETTKDPRLLLKIFVKALPNIPYHRRIPLLKTTMRLMQESTSLPVLLFLLLENSLIPAITDETLHKRVNTKLTEDNPLGTMENFSGIICEEYDINVCFPAFLALLREWDQQVSKHAWKLGDKIIMFISKQLEKAETVTKAQDSLNEAAVKAALSGMLEESLSLLQKLAIETQNGRNSNHKAKNRLQKSASFLLDCITNLLSPASFAEAIINLLKSEDENLRNRAFALVTAKMNTIGQNDGDTEVNTRLYQNDVSADTLNAYEKLVETIGMLLDNSCDYKLDRRSIVSALHSCSKRLAKRVPSAFVASLQMLLSLLSHGEYPPGCLECISSIIVEVGLNVLPMLNKILKVVTMTSKHTAHATDGFSSSGYRKETDLDMGVLSVLEAVVAHLSGFLNPHLDDILQLLLLEPRFFSSADKRINERAQSLCNLLVKAIPVRLLLGSLIDVYDRSLEKGESSVLACIDMLILVVTSFEKPSVQAHYKTVFELCLRSFDLRRHPPLSITCIAKVETAIISLFSALVLKLSEITFKPLFIRVLEWAESVAPNEDDKRGAIRFIVFYRMVNQLADKLRSVFVPYFQYFLKTCTQQLMDDQGGDIDKPKKKLKISKQLANKKQTSILTGNEWHLRYLIVCSLQKCFLYDTIGFLDTEKFQMLLEPLVGQIYVSRPPSIESDDSEQIPSTQDMDCALVACLGQMAVTAGTDLLWKPLNHEVLLCTRSDTVRVKIVSLDIVRFMVDNLKEDYLALLPETIPFLAELLEDHEQLVVSKSQQIIKLLEDLSGESLSQYL